MEVKISQINKVQLTLQRLVDCKLLNLFIVIVLKWISIGTGIQISH